MPSQDASQGHDDHSRTSSQTANRVGRILPDRDLDVVQVLRSNAGRAHELAAAALDRIAPNMIFTNVPIEHVLRRVSDSVDVRLRIDWDSIRQPGIERNHANHALDRPLQVEQRALERHQAGSRTSKSLQRLIVQLAETRVSIASITQTLADR